MNNMSRYLNHRQLNTIERIGNIMVPAHGKFPSFSESGCLYHIDTLLQPAPIDDRNSLKTVLTILSWLPDSILCWLLHRLEHADAVPGPIGTQLRLLSFGLKGTVFSLYYSGLGSPDNCSTVYAALNYQVHCQPDHQE